MAELLKGAAVAAAITERLQRDVAALKAGGVQPCLALLRVGERADDVYYEKSAVKRCEKTGVVARCFTLPAAATTEQVLAIIAQINADPAIHGCLVFRPLPPGVDDQRAPARSPERERRAEPGRSAADDDAVS